MLQLLSSGSCLNFLTLCSKNSLLKMSYIFSIIAKVQSVKREAKVMFVFFYRFRVGARNDEGRFCTALRQAQGTPSTSSGSGLVWDDSFFLRRDYFFFLAKQYRATEGVFNGKARQALEGRAKHVA